MTQALIERAVERADERADERAVAEPANLQPAPPGFTEEQWRSFMDEGILVLPDALAPEEVAHYRAAIDTCATRAPAFDPARTWKISDAIREHPAFRGLIAHPRHIGYPYDLYGDQTRLVQCDVFMRPRQGWVNHWHVDGPRALPFSMFSPEVPLKLRVGYWLTDVEAPNMGNFVYLPGSHRAKPEFALYGNGHVDGEKTLLCRAGTITLAHPGLWHRVSANETDRVRINMFLSYTPSWVTGYHLYDDAFAATLTREERIVLRHYGDQKSYTRPPDEDIPLFDDPGALPAEIGPGERHKVFRSTRWHRFLSRL